MRSFSSCYIEKDVFKMKKIFKALAVASVLALALTAFAACGNSEKSSAAEKTQASEEKNESAEDKDTATEAPAEAAVDYDKPDVTIEEGDYDGMKTCTDDMLAGKYDGKVVKVTGISTRSQLSVKGSIMQSNGSGSKHGCTYMIKDAETIDAYPAEDATVELTGVVKIGEYDVRYLEVPQDKLTVL